MNCLLCHCSFFNKQRYFFGFSLNAKYLYVCKDCNLGQINYDSDIIPSYYKNNDKQILNYNFDIDSVFPIHEVIKKANKYNKINKVLDIGAGNGHFLFSAKQNNIKYLGVEPSITKVNNCKKIGLDYIINGDIEELTSNDKYHEEFDLILLDNVFEHLEDPLNSLKRIKTLLNKNGIIIIIVPNCNDNYYKCRTDDHVPHLTFWNKKSLEMLAEKYNFTKLELGSHGPKLKKNNILRLKNNLKHICGWFLKNYFSFIFKYKKSKKSSAQYVIHVNQNDFMNSYNIKFSKDDFNYKSIYIILKKN